MVCVVDTPLSPSRPASDAAAPFVALDVNGLAASPQELSALRAVTVQQQLSAPARCELWFTDDTAEPPLARRLVPGALVRLVAGPRAETLFAGEVAAVEWLREAGGRRSLCVQAYDALYTLQQRHSISVHVGQTVLEIAADLAAGTGLDVRGPDRLPVWPRLIQYRRSDLDFLNLLASRCGLYLDARAGTLTFLTLDGAGRPKRLVFGENLHEARTETNAGNTDRSFSGVATGDAGLRPGVRIDVGGLAARQDGRWVVTSARHTIDRRVYLTDVGTRPPAVPAGADGFLMVPGEVRCTDDPDRLGRVRISLPTIGGFETDWLCVPGSGGAGRPEAGPRAEPGARVVALVAIDNPATGVVLGEAFGASVMACRPTSPSSPPGPRR